MGNTSYHNPHKITIPASYEVLDHTYSWRRKDLKIYSLDTEPLSVIAWSFCTLDFMSYLALPSGCPIALELGIPKQNNK